MIANQLNTTNNTLDALIPAPADGSGFFKYSGGYAGYVFDAFANGGPPLPGAWTGVPASPTLNPGEAGLFRDAGGGTGQTLTFVGEVLQGQLVNTLPVGNSVRASIVPQAGMISSDLGVPGEDGDGAFVYNGSYSGYVYDAFKNGGPPIPGGWTGQLPASQGGGPVADGGPPVAVGQGFFYKKVVGGTATSWVRNFTVQ
jgi:hypothetical protein